MTKRIILYLILFYLPLMAISQIGVNTENPKALLHIDGRSSVATTNPSTGNVTPAQAVDDIVITNDGLVGIGTLTPTVKVDIANTYNGSALSLKDGNEGQNQVLISDADGFGRWSSVGATWFATLIRAKEIIAPALGTTLIKDYTNERLSDLNQGSTDAVSGIIVVPFTGNYKLTITGWYANTFAPIVNLPYRATPVLYINGSATDWAPYIYGTTLSFGVAPTYVCMRKLNAGDSLSIYLDHSNYYTANRAAGINFIVEYY